MQVESSGQSWSEWYFIYSCSNCSISNCTCINCVFIFISYLYFIVSNSRRKECLDVVCIKITALNIKYRGYPGCECRYKWINYAIRSVNVWRWYVEIVRWRLCVRWVFNIDAINLYREWKFTSSKYSNLSRISSIFVVSCNTCYVSSVYLIPVGNIR